MELVRLDNLAPRGWASPAVSVGNFDGLHLGHQALVSGVMREARLSSGTAVVLTFDPHPARVLSPGRAPSTLLTLPQKAEILDGLGADVLAVLPFTRELASQGPAEFAERVLKGAVGARVVVVGRSFRFGHARAGDLALLTSLGERLSFTVQAVEPVIRDGLPVSSTRIREALAAGDVAQAQALLGRRFFVDGAVVHGAGRGRSLGVPTANVQPLNETVPRAGVYAAWCLLELEAGPRAAVVNVGHRPTFGADRITLEAHLLDFDGDLYGRALRIEFEARLRDERTFAGAGQLVDQIRLDIERARRVLEKA